VSIHRTPHIGRFPGSPYSFVVMSRAVAESYELTEPHVLISIGGSGTPVAPHPQLPSRVAVLRVQFDDVGYERLEAARAGLWPDEPEPDWFDSDRAERIRSFVENHRDDATWIACHCEAGMSRSPAVAAALSRWLNGDDVVADAITHWIAVDRLGFDDDVIFWNRLVHDRLLEVLQPPS
jgi:predicted protein tyrosine phosphatase